MDTEAVDNGAMGWRSWFRRSRAHRISASERALIAAQGKALAVLATALQASGHFDGKRFADMLAIFGAVVSEDDDLQGSILALWADAVGESMDVVC